jgi:hypothetical protein
MDVRFERRWASLHRLANLELWPQPRAARRFADLEQLLDSVLVHNFVNRLSVFVIIFDRQVHNLRNRS